MLGLGETLARRRGLLRAMKSLRGLEDYYRRIVFSVADQSLDHVDALTNRQPMGEKAREGQVYVLVQLNGSRPLSFK